MKKMKMMGLLAAALLAACSPEKPATPPPAEEMPTARKTVIYQVFARLFGNKQTANKPWGSMAENGVGKFSDFTDKALQEIKGLGVTHVWYTGVPHHALVNDYTAYGISNDDPDVVKGRAGSPYAVKDYYNVNPDLADDPAKRLEEFQALLARTHAQGLKAIIDIVPNHIARRYEGKTNPEGVSDFGAADDPSAEYRKHNNFYYIPGQPFRVPVPENGYRPLGGERHPLADGRFEENPAKWTGNGSRLAQPHFGDWYETVKINYGIRPDGTKDFDALPQGFEEQDAAAHYAFWQGKDVPDSWKKFRDIAYYWLDMGVDGFRFDMAEMVPVEFWSYLNASIKQKKADALLLAEVYNPALYRDYIRLGKMDYLYDKVEFYDTLKHIMQGHGLTDNLPAIQTRMADIEHNMLHFLENHDEQRLASPEFAGDARKGMPAMTVSATISTSPTMVYFGQEVGEPGAEDAGFGKPSRTSIFDYVGVPSHQRWMNGGAFDGGQLSEGERELRDFYRRLLNFTISSPALMGQYAEIHGHNRQAQVAGYDHRVFSFARWAGSERLLVLANFDEAQPRAFELQVPPAITGTWGLSDGDYPVAERLYGNFKGKLRVEGGIGYLKVELPALGSMILQVQ
jgi:glycosidase